MKHAVQKFSGQYKLAKTKQKILLPRNAIVTHSLCSDSFFKKFVQGDSTPALDGTHRAAIKRGLWGDRGNGFRIHDLNRHQFLLLCPSDFNLFSHG